MGLIYFGIRVTDLERSLDFYVHGLGLEVLRRGGLPHGGRRVLLVDRGTAQRLELNWYPKGSPYAVPYVAGEGLDHLGVEVADARATIRELIGRGATLAIEPWLEEGRYWIGFVRDPDGLWIEVQSRVEGAPSAPSASS